ncbi:MAG: hypothetical protein Q6373_009480 [Candidatus Sigynarchaeota archaeon]
MKPSWKDLIPHDNPCWQFLEHLPETLPEPDQKTLVSWSKGCSITADEKKRIDMIRPELRTIRRLINNEAFDKAYSRAMKILEICANSEPTRDLQLPRLSKESGYHRGELLPACAIPASLGLVNEEYVQASQNQSWGAKDRKFNDFLEQKKIICKK